MVAAVSSWQTHHQLASGEIQRRLDAGETLVVAAPALVEAYAVLTRLPPPYRISPTTALTLLDTNFMGAKVEIIALESVGYRRLLLQAVDESFAGGRIYDIVILACAIAGRADVLLTFNDRHFQAPDSDAIEIVVPA